MQCIPIPQSPCELEKKNSLHCSPSLPSEMKQLWQNVRVLQNAGAPQGLCVQNASKSNQAAFCRERGSPSAGSPGSLQLPLHRAASALSCCLPGFLSGCLKALAKGVCLRWGGSGFARGTHAPPPVIGTAGRLKSPSELGPSGCCASLAWVAESSSCRPSWRALAER